MSVDLTADSSLDAILTEVGGFGLFQVATYFLICLPNILSASYVINYMISANTLDYRCKVPECDVGANNRDIKYDQEWLKLAIPFNDNNHPESCTRYAPNNISAVKSRQCSAELFDKSTKIECSEFVYASDEKNVQTEFNIHCSDSYKLALVGTINNIGRFIFLPLTGLLSDRFGRLTVVIIGMSLSSVFGLIKSFSINYPMYIALEFFESSAGTCTFAGIYILGIEWVNSRYRVLGSTIISVSYPIGEMLLGIIAMYVHDFRDLIRISYAPGLLLFAYFWLVPESVRWLLVTGRVDRAVNTLKRIARFNGKELSPKLIELIKLRYSPDLIAKNNPIENNSVIQSFCSILKSKTLCLRFLNCCYQWSACCFSYYGMSLLATHIPGQNRYTSFIFVVGIEIPAILLALPLLNKIKRRVIMCFTFAIAAIAIVVTPCIPDEHHVIVLIFFMLGKASMTCAFTSLYIFTAEQWPTNVRTTVMNSCSMIGRIGAMVAPVTVILGSQYKLLPEILFGVTALIASILVLFSPETHSKKLPDTIEEAEEL